MFLKVHKTFRDTILIINEQFIHTNKLSVIFVSFGRLFYKICKAIINNNTRFRVLIIIYLDI